VHTVRVRNGGDTVEEYQFSVIGPLTEYATVDPDLLRLYPGDEGTATVTFTLPRAREVAAGPTPFGVRVVPRVHPELSDVAEGTVTVTPFAEIKADMIPVTVRGRLSARLRPTVENLGNAPLEARLIGRDDEDVLQFEEQTTPLVVPSGTTGRPVMRVRPRRRKFTGGADRFPFSITVAPTRQAEAAGALPVQLRGTYVRLALVPTWLLILLALLVLAGLVLSGVSYLRTINFGQPSFAAPAAPAPAPSPNDTPPQEPPPEPGDADQDEDRDQDEPEQDQGQRPAQGTVTIAHSGRALTASSTTGRAGAPAPVTQQTGTGAANRQQWELRGVQNNSFVIVAGVDDGRALDQPDTGADRPLVLGEFDGRRVSGSQVWELRAVGSGGTAIVNAATGHCLTDSGDGRNVVASQCRGGTTQIWTIQNP
jgi:hypothetical protein